MKLKVKVTTYFQGIKNIKRFEVKSSKEVNELKKKYNDLKYNGVYDLVIVQHEEVKQ